MRRSEAFPPEPSSAGGARRLVTRALEEWNADELVDTCSLLVSELVTNSLLHAASDVLVHVDLDDQLVRVGVADRSTTVPVRRQYGAQAATGRGLELVEALATRWGIDTGPEGKTAWFEVSLDGSVAEEDEAAVDTPEQEDHADPLFAVRFERLPVALMWATIQHGEALLREATLLAMAGRADEARSRSPVLDLTAVIEPVRQAHDQGVAVVDIEVGFPRRAENDALQRLALVDEAERLAEEGRLLTPALPEVAACRHWLLGEVVRQLGGDAPVPWQLPSGNGEASGGRTLEPSDRQHLERLTTAAIAADNSNHICYVNERAAAILGWTMSELTGRRLTVIVPPELREAHLAGYTRYQLTGEGNLIGQPVRIAALAKDGSLVDIELLIETLGASGELFVATFRPTG